MTRQGQSGVTLIEMMIVLSVIGVATGAATLGLGALARDDAAEQAARRLKTIIESAVDTALISGVPQVLVWDAQSYRIGAMAPHVLSPLVTLARKDGRGDAVVLLPDATSPAVDFLLEGKADTWHVSFDGLSAAVTGGVAP